MKLDVPLIRRIHRRLHSRHQKTGDKGLLAVGLGRAKKGGGFDASRPKAVIYLVKKKKPDHRVYPKHAIPKLVPVFLEVATGKKKRRKKFWFSTDVIEIGSKVRLTCLRADSVSKKFFTVGALVSWGNPVIYGVLSVGHGVPAGVGSGVTVTLPGASSVAAEVVAFTSGPATQDASLIKFTQPIPSLIPPPGAALPPTPPSYNDLATMASNGVDAISCTLSNRLPIVLQVYAPSIPIDDPPYTLTDVVMAQGNADTFEEGTSGSVWLKSDDGTPLAIQVAGAPDTTNPPPVFIYGFAQPLSEHFNWANSQKGVKGTLQLISIL
jgi:hypothetical protein